MNLITTHTNTYTSIALKLMVHSSSCVQKIPKNHPGSVIHEEESGMQPVVTLLTVMFSGMLHSTVSTEGVHGQLEDSGWFQSPIPVSHTRILWDLKQWAVWGHAWYLPSRNSWDSGPNGGHVGSPPPGTYHSRLSSSSESKNRMFEHRPCCLHNLYPLMVRTSWNT